MAKFGIGVGEEFPVDDAVQRNPPPDVDGLRPTRHRGGWHVFLHVLTRLALIALVVSAIVWLFQPHYYGYFHGPYAFYPTPYHGFFFPFFPVLLIVLLLAFARRRGRLCYDMQRWHDEVHRERGEGA